MTTPRILIVGYYGRGNFGDDLLLHITFRLLKTALPTSQISIIVDGNDGHYIQTMLDDVTILPPGRHGHFDYIIHGGGGVFFDFESYGLMSVIAERIIHTIGLANFIRMEKMLRSIVRKPRTTATRRIGLGIGVGRFSNGSKRLRNSVPILADFSALWLRDDESSANLQRFASIMRADIIHGSDLAFLTDQWLPPLPPRTPAPRPRLGIALRDWPQQHITAEFLKKLSEHYSITGFILDATTDTNMQQLLNAYSRHIWQPSNLRVGDFATALATQDVILTSRAHGAICGACVGVPTVIVNIEPKLEQVHAMLPNASILVAANAPETWQAAIEKALAIQPETIRADVDRNHEKTAAAWAAMQRWFA